MNSSSSVFWLSVCLAGTVMGGCASHHASSFSRQLIGGGNRPIGAVAPVAAAKGETFEAYVQRVKALAIAARPEHSASMQSSAESLSSELTAAILRAEFDHSAESHYVAGEAYRVAGVLDAAHRYLTRAIELDPTDARAFDALARIWRDWGYPNLAFGDASRALYHAPNSAAVHNTLGTLYQALGRRDEARAAYRRALAIDPAAAYALNNLCYLSFLDGKASTAIGECESALRLSPNSAPTRNNLGLIYASLGELQSARREFTTAGRTARAAYNMGIAQLSMGNYSEAIAAFQDALVADPTMYRASQRAAEARRRGLAAASVRLEPDHERE